jgi:prophage tail gpP-like protein
MIGHWYTLVLQRRRRVPADRFNYLAVLRDPARAHPALAKMGHRILMLQMARRSRRR